MQLSIIAPSLRNAGPVPGSRADRTSVLPRHARGSPFCATPG